MNSESTLGARLREERERLNLSQDSLGEAGGVGRTAQYNYEQDKRIPDALYLIAVAPLGIDVVYVMFGVRTNESASSTRTLSPSTPAMTLTDEEADLLASYRSMSGGEKSSLLNLLGVISSKRGARKRSNSDVRQVIKGKVGQVISGGNVTMGNIVMGDTKRSK